MNILTVLTAVVGMVVVSGCSENDERLAGNWQKVSSGKVWTLWHLDFKNDGNVRLKTSDFSAHAKWETESDEYLLFSENNGLLSRRCSYNIQPFSAWSMNYLTLDGCVTTYAHPQYFIKVEDIEKRKTEATEQAVNLFNDYWTKVEYQDYRGMADLAHERAISESGLNKQKLSEKLEAANKWLENCETENLADKIEIEKVEVSRIFSDKSQEAIVKFHFSLRCKFAGAAEYSESQAQGSLHLIGGENGWLFYK